MCISILRKHHELINVKMSLLQINNRNEKKRSRKTVWFTDLLEVRSHTVKRVEKRKTMHFPESFLQLSGIE
jgi:hypothetical protein